MENASKALLIAGSILITIIIITIVVIYFQNGANTTSQVANNTLENLIQNHNAQFNIYEGAGRKKADIDRLKSIVDRNNNRKDRVCYVDFQPTGVDFSNLDEFGKIKFYEVTVEYNDQGAIYKVEVN